MGSKEKQEKRTVRTYKFKSDVWLYPGNAAWHFITVPEKESKDIKNKFGANARGWGSIPVCVILGKSEWTTSIFPDRKSGTYLLPLKAEVRKREGIKSGDDVNLSIHIELG